MRSRKTALQSRKEKADRFKTGSRRAVRKREQIGRSSREIRVPAVRMTAATESRVRAVRPEIAKMITEKPEQGRSAAIIPKRRGEKTANPERSPVRDFNSPYFGRTVLFDRVSFS